MQVLKIQFQVLALICFEIVAFIFNFLDTAQLIFFVPFYKLVMEVL
ncbi:not available [Yersinia enterocolitica]|nr:not available [Yersinia enterocolitica]